MNLKCSARSVRGPSNWAHLVSHTKSEKHQLASKSLQRSHAIARTTLSPAPGSRCNWRCFGFGTHWFHLAQINIHVWRQRSIFTMVVFILAAKYELPRQLTILCMIIIADSEKHRVSYWRVNTKRTSQSVQSLKLYLNSTLFHSQQQV